MKLQNDRTITISTGESRKDLFWKEEQISVGDLWERLRMPHRGDETLSEYMALKKSKQDDLKDVGGFVGGALKGGRRKQGMVLGRDLITLDLDSIPPDSTEVVLFALKMTNVSWCVYSTRKHRPEAPRLRILFPLSRTVSADEYEPIARWMADEIKIEWADPTTFEANRLMFWPSCCADGEYVFRYEDAPLLNPDEVLGRYTDWKDFQNWPKTPLEKDQKKRSGKQADPTEKGGIIGAFCRRYDIHAAISEFLADRYAQCGDPDRYTYLGGSTNGGAVVYDGGLYLYSHHATDPCGGIEVNSFDLVRIHKFGDQDRDALPGTPTHKLPSYKLMCEFAEAIPEVGAIVAEERRQQAMREFEGIAENPPDHAAIEEFVAFEGQQISCEIVQAAMKACGYSIRRDVITGETVVTGLSDQFSEGNALNTLPVLIKDVLKKHKIKGVTDQGVSGYLGVIADKSRFNPVEEMFRSIQWDGADRLCEAYKMVGTESAFEQTMIRKWLIQCVAMAMNSEKRPINADGVLTLQGEEGSGKTEFFRRIAVRPEWFAEGVSLDMQNKDSILRSINVWICELGELDSTSRRNQSALKSHLTAVSDRIREPYARAATRRPRRTSYAATVNPEDFLTGSTGNRRFWVIHVENMDLKKILEITPEWAQQLWAQVFRIWERDPSGFRLTSEERHRIMDSNRKYQSFLPGEEELIGMLDFDLPVEQWQYYATAQIAAILTLQVRQTITGQAAGRIMSRIMQDYPQIEKRTGAHRISEYRLPLHYKSTIQ